MKISIIADSSALVSLISETDKNYSKALAISRNLENKKGSVIIPSEVFSETMNIIGKKLNHRIALQTAETIFASTAFLIADSTEKLRRDALQLFKKQSSSTSFTDCVVMAFADQYLTKDIFGFDEVFRKNGYRRVGLGN